MPCGLSSCTNPYSKLTEHSHPHRDKAKAWCSITVVSIHRQLPSACGRSCEVTLVCVYMCLGGVWSQQLTSSHWSCRKLHSVLLLSTRTCKLASSNWDATSSSACWGVRIYKASPPPPAAAQTPASQTGLINGETGHRATFADVRQLSYFQIVIALPVEEHACY